MVAALKALIRLVYPDISCLACSEEAPLNDYGLCSGCAIALTGERAPEFTAPEPLLDARAAFIHGGVGRKLVHALKYDGLRQASLPLGKAMAELIDPDWHIDSLVPVPLHRLRRRERGFNQALDLAKAVSKLTGIPVSEPLVRVRDTGTQTALHYEARVGNVSGAFISKPCFGNLLLIDDVFTTGSTLCFCSMALIGAGASRVCALTATRTALD